MADTNPQGRVPDSGSPNDGPVGQVNLKPPPAATAPTGGAAPARQVTVRDVLLGIGALIIIVLGFIVILQGAYQLTPS